MEVSIPLSKVLYHFWSSASVGLLAWLLMYSTGYHSSWMGPRGSTASTYWRHLAIPLSCSVLAHVFLFDIVEHGEPPAIIEGLTGLVKFLLGLL